MAACSVSFSEALATAGDERRRAVTVPSDASVDPEVDSLLRTVSSRMNEVLGQIATLKRSHWAMRMELTCEQ
eukprot:3843183-Lingulodinium_polyedra.AAC.1